jgi:predicted nucleic acid-binding protein
MYLVDANVWLERLLNQARSEEVERFINHVPSEQLFITDFAFHSIGVVLSRLKRVDGLLRFVQDAFVDGAVVLVRLDPQDMQRLVSLIGELNLDFDDAYQYVAAEKYDLTIVSFDGDFDRTERGRKAPLEVVQGLA